MKGMNTILVSFRVLLLATLCIGSMACGTTLSSRDGFTDARLDHSDWAGRSSADSHVSRR
jgi:hypothetical protein